MRYEKVENNGESERKKKWEIWYQKEVS